MSKYATRLGPGLIDWSENLPDLGRFPGTSRPTLSNERLWKLNDVKANKEGPRHMVYWVGTKPKIEDGTVDAEPYFIKETYQGQWKDNMKHGYGVQTYKNGDRYEGQWLRDKRHGEGVLWVRVPGSKSKFRREFTGGWFEDKRCGAGTCYYSNADRYEGQWRDGKRHGQGHMHYVNGDIYEGSWLNNSRHGYGAHTSANGDVYQGYWYNDLKEGAGALYFFTSGRVLTGEWCQNQMKTGVLCKAEEAPGEVKAVGRLAAIQRRQVPIQKLELKDPVEVLRQSLEQIRKDRFFRLRPKEAQEWQENEQRKADELAERTRMAEEAIADHFNDVGSFQNVDEDLASTVSGSLSTDRPESAYSSNGSPLHARSPGHADAEKSKDNKKNVGTIGDLRTIDTLGHSPSPTRKRLGEMGQKLIQQ